MNCSTGSSWFIWIWCNTAYKKFFIAQSVGINKTSPSKIIGILCFADLNWPLPWPPVDLCNSRILWCPLTPIYCINYELRIHFFMWMMSWRLFFFASKTKIGGCQVKVTVIPWVPSFLPLLPLLFWVTTFMDQAYCYMAYKSETPTVYFFRVRCVPCNISHVCDVITMWCSVTDKTNIQALALKAWPQDGCCCLSCICGVVQALASTGR